MGAGLSKERQRGIEYRQLRKIMRELDAVGVDCSYEKRAVRGTKFTSNADNMARIYQFSISFNRMNASNGECCLYPVISIRAIDPPDPANGAWRGWWDERTYVKGLEHLKRLFGKSPKESEVQS